MANESTESIKNEVEPVVNEAVNKIYKQGEKSWLPLIGLFDSIKDQHGEGYHALAILDVMYPKLAPKEQKLLAMRIPCGDTMGLVRSGFTGGDNLPISYFFWINWLF